MVSICGGSESDADFDVSFKQCPMLQPRYAAQTEDATHRMDQYDGR